MAIYKGGKDYLDKFSVCINHMDRIACFYFENRWLCQECKIKKLECIKDEIVSRV